MNFGIEGPFFKKKKFLRAFKSKWWSGWIFFNFVAYVTLFSVGIYLLFSR